MSNGIKLVHLGKEFMRIDSSGNLGIGTSAPGEVLVGSWSEWCEIKKLAETNTAVKIALDKLMTVYYLSKDAKDTNTLDW
jgi:hypothetical protein